MGASSTSDDDSQDISEGERLSSPLQVRSNGAKLETITQALAYKGLIEQRKRPKRQRTSINLDKIRAAIEEVAGKQPSDKKIWNSIQTKDISMKGQELIFSIIHDTFFVGDKWKRENMPAELYESASCHAPRCGDQEESMDHILTMCTAPGQNTIWDLAKELWEMTGRQWPGTCLGKIMGCTVIDFSEGNNRADKLAAAGANRLYKIIMAESVQLIWAIRCERVIGGKQHTEVEIHNRWLFRINKRLKLDQALTKKKSFGNRTIQEGTVTGTWKGTLANENNLPKHWVWDPGVLVGIPPAIQRVHKEQG
ncbi:hypothetical protein FISHEDRAFT_33125 [Fistulina hepatica ATCC 64428]|uniref:Reverse transcriptase zinc-binding domain-containing protein n=1 Tax=Fistulina hepatica ATCC 64428 TaxID=1128425 RepID=A0A0D7ANR0_9AGAR|nr:hypothetical protein FISHEDRAFT_33125 [Fistulina hepatica ATCC 64428]